MSVTVISEGIKNFQRYVESLPQITHQAARLALNDTADTARRKLIPAAIRAQVAFPPGYLEDDDKLAVTDRATNDKLQVTITARKRATSLARFAPGAQPGQRGTPISVKVNPGNTVVLRKAFAVRLRSGTTLTDDNYNVGLAVRLKPGQTLRNRHLASVQFADGIVLLYAPSVDQVFRTVADDLVDPLGQMVEDEFLRQFVRLAE